MFKKFIGGLLFGAGFLFAIVIGASIFIYFSAPNIVDYEEISNVPELDGSSLGFLGSAAAYTGGFSGKVKGVLVEGDGQITGSVTAEGVPVAGLRFRLGLNGKVHSAWTVSDKTGSYSIRVPYGVYRIDGYELDYSSANRVLSGYTDFPGRPYRKQPITVSSESSGKGLDLKFVRPVIKRTESERYDLNEDIFISWDPVPDAVEYKIQMYKTNSLDELNREALFDWGQLPVTNALRWEVTANSDDLEAGYFYSYEISALDLNGRAITKSVRDYNGYDFEIR